MLLTHSGDFLRNMRAFRPRRAKYLVTAAVKRDTESLFTPARSGNMMEWTDLFILVAVIGGVVLMRKSGIVPG